MDNKVCCKYEDWDDTYYPEPVCHCLFRDNMDCVNGDDVASCPDYKPFEEVRMDKLALELAKHWLLEDGFIPEDEITKLFEAKDKAIDTFKWLIAKGFRQVEAAHLLPEPFPLINGMTENQVPRKVKWFKQGFYAAIEDLNKANPNGLWTEVKE